MTDQGDLVYITIAVEAVPEKYLSLHQAVAQLHDEDGNEVGSITTTAGLGGDVIFFDWKGRKGRVRMSQILAEWVKSFDLEGARRLPIVGPPEPAPVHERLVDRIADLEVDGDAKG